MRPTPSGAIITSVIACGLFLWGVREKPSVTLPCDSGAQDDIQYIPSLEEFLLPETVRAHQEYKARGAGDKGEPYNPIP